MSSTNLEDQILRYKIIYSTIALILGLSTVIGGYWLGSLDGSYVSESHFEVTGWMLHVFGCAILYNNNNLAPCFWLILVGLFLIIVTQYRIRTNRKLKAEHNLDRQALRSKFIYSVVGLFVGLFVTIYGVTFAESGIDLCPADLVPIFQDRNSYIWISPIIFIVGLIIMTTTRYRIRIYKNPERETTDK
jgi:cytochrome c-type biogenesis protein CcmH/NrfF